MATFHSEREQMISILFVCTANQFRSPLAAALFASEVNKHNSNLEINISSAGIWAYSNKPARAEAIALGKQFGLDLHNHRSREVSESILTENDLILVMDSGQKEALIQEFSAHSFHVFLLSEAAGFYPFDVPNPYSMHIDPKFVAADICKIVSLGFDEILKLAQKIALEKTIKVRDCTNPPIEESENHILTQTELSTKRKDQLIINQAKEALRADDRSKAYNILQTYTQNYPEDEEGWLLLGGLTTRQNSLLYLRRAEQLAPNDPRVHKAMIWALDGLTENRTPAQKDTGPMDQSLLSI
jgi:protein-tyrosine phosphatase